MGSGIATICIMNGFTCYIKEINQKFLDLALLKVKGILNKMKISLENFRKFIKISEIWKIKRKKNVKNLKFINSNFRLF